MRNSRSKLRRILGPLGKSKSLTAGTFILVGIIVVALVGPIVAPREGMKMASFPRDLPPSATNPLGTDTVGRDLFTLLVYSLQQSLVIGLLAGLIGITLGVLIGFLAGYKGGLLDDALRSTTDIFLVIPTWPLLVLLSAYVKGLTIPLMALLLAAFSWPGAARGMRSQILSLRERGFVNLAKLSGEGDLGVIFKEITPNVLPYIGVMLGGSVSGAMLAEVGLEIIGLGPSGSTTLGLMIYWATFYGAMIKRMWWWIAPPVICLVAIFIGLQLFNIGLDQLYNPRLRR